MHAITSPPVLSYPDFHQPFILHVDASTKELGCSLYQQTHGKLCVLAFGSRALSKAEKRYQSSMLEFLALKLAACSQFGDCLLHAPKVEVYTDNNPLVYVLPSAKLSATGQRWVNELARFNLLIHYKLGRNHQDADALIRFPENIYQYTSRAGQSSINAIFEGIQTQSENEEALLCEINANETAPETNISPLYKNNLQQVDIYHEQNQDHCIKKVEDIIQSRVQLSLSQKQREPQLVKRLLRENEKLLINNKEVVIRRTLTKLTKLSYHQALEIWHIENNMKKWVI